MARDAVNAAKKRIWIASPYFVPDDAVMTALHLAALRGVDVRVIIPDQPDSKLVYYSAYSYFEEAAGTGIRFFRYTDGFLHQKVVLLDDDVSAVGTANFDNRSFRLNFEITAVIFDPGKTQNGEEILIPNSTVAQSMVRNLTRGDRLGRIECFVSVASSSDLESVRNALVSAVASLEWKSEAREATVYVDELGESSIRYVVSVWIDEVTHSSRMRSELNEAMWRSLKKAGVSLAP